MMEGADWRSFRYADSASPGAVGGSVASSDLRGHPEEPPQGRIAEQVLPD